MYIPISIGQGIRNCCGGSVQKIDKPTLKQKFSTLTFIDDWSCKWLVLTNYHHIALHTQAISPLHPELAVSMQYHGADAPVAAALSGWWPRRSGCSGLRALSGVKFLQMSDAFCSLFLSQRGIPSAASTAHLFFGFASHPSQILVYSVGYPAYLLSLVLIMFFALYLAHSVTLAAVYVFSHTYCLQIHKFLFTLWWRHYAYT